MRAQWTGVKPQLCQLRKMTQMPMHSKWRWPSGHTLLLLLVQIYLMEVEKKAVVMVRRYLMTCIFLL
jgi:hypothetical protein